MQRRSNRIAGTTFGGALPAFELSDPAQAEKLDDCLDMFVE